MHKESILERVDVETKHQFTLLHNLNNDTDGGKVKHWKNCVAFKGPLDQQKCYRSKKIGLSDDA